MNLLFQRYPTPPEGSPAAERQRHILRRKIGNVDALALACDHAIQLRFADESPAQFGGRAYDLGMWVGNQTSEYPPGDGSGYPMFEVQALFRKLERAFAEYGFEAPLMIAGKIGDLANIEVVRALVILPRHHDERAVDALKKIVARHRRRKFVARAAVAELDHADWPIPEVLLDIAYLYAGELERGSDPDFLRIF